MPCIRVESQFEEAFDEKMGTVVLKAADVTGSHFTKGFKQRKCIYVHDFEDLIFETIRVPPNGYEGQFHVSLTTPHVPR